jgi:Protein of unknown function (DUF1523)
MLEVWLSLGYVLLLAILLFAFVLRRKGGAATAIAAIVVGLPLWFGWEYARPAWTTGTVSGTAVRRSDPDARGNIRDVEYIFMRNRADAGVEVANEDSWWWLKRNTERVFNDAMTAQGRNTQVTIMWDRWRSTVFSFYPNVVEFGRAGSWPLWSWRTVLFYAFSIVIWVGYFHLFAWLHRRTSKRDAVAA